MRSIRPGRSKALSIRSGRLVAATIVTFSRVSTPSNSISARPLGEGAAISSSRSKRPHRLKLEFNNSMCEVVARIKHFCASRLLFVASSILRKATATRLTTSVVSCLGHRLYLLKSSLPRSLSIKGFEEVSVSLSRNREDMASHIIVLPHPEEP
uniref:Uncharacterized protein n=1 Tax=Glossina palpalis gambiensis TaxID=67801 RepID=A0A1B0C4Z8_9MUSC